MIVKIEWMRLRLQVRRWLRQRGFKRADWRRRKERELKRLAASAAAKSREAAAALDEAADAMEADLRGLGG